MRHARREIAKQAMGGFQCHPTQYLATVYHHAREDAVDGTGLLLATFAEACPWPVEPVLDAEFWPEARP
jgi:Domain of unknown function DUF29